MMAQRSRADKVEDGRKGAVRKIAQYGPDELNRAGRQAAWTKQHPGRNKSENPYLREKICQPTDLDRAKNFEALANAHPNEPHSQNVLMGQAYHVTSFRQLGGS
jgi:hypothetical protein